MKIIKKDKHYTGYAIVSKDILDDKVYKSGHFGISLSGRDFDTCKRYCRGGSIVVKTYRVVLYRFIKIKWIKKYPVFRYSRKYEYPKFFQLGHLCFEWGTNHTDEYEREAVYDPLVK